MSKETFVVGCAGGGIQSGVVFIDLASLSLSEKDEEGKPLREVAHRLFLTPEGAMETYQNLKGALDRLVELGILKVRDPGEEGGEGEKKSGNGGSQPKSPNF